MIWYMISTTENIVLLTTQAIFKTANFRRWGGLCAHTRKKKSQKIEKWVEAEPSSQLPLSKKALAIVVKNYAKTVIKVSSLCSSLLDLLTLFHKPCPRFNPQNLKKNNARLFLIRFQFVYGSSTFFCHITKKMFSHLTLLCNTQMSQK